MRIVPIQLPKTVFSTLRKNPKEFIQEMRIAAAEHTPFKGATSLHWAACHACLFSPETEMRSLSQMGAILIMEAVKARQQNDSPSPKKDKGSK